MSVRSDERRWWSVQDSLVHRSPCSWTHRVCHFVTRTVTKFDLVRVALPSEEPYSSRSSVWLNRRPYMLLMRYKQRNTIVLLDSNAPSTVWATLHHCEGATEENEDPWYWSYKSTYLTRLWLTDFNWFDGIQSHILAARTVANIIRTSLGPRGKR